jgi:methyl-accepting chemotaxis protein
VLTYRTSEEAAVAWLASQFKAQQERFLAQSKEMARFDRVAEASERFRQVDGATREFYGLADQVLTQHGQWVCASIWRELELAFIRRYLPVGRRSVVAADRSKRSRSKPELITSALPGSEKYAGPMPRPISMSGEGARQGYRDGANGSNGCRCPMT